VNRHAAVALVVMPTVGSMRVSASPVVVKAGRRFARAWVATAAAADAANRRVDVTAAANRPVVATAAVNPRAAAEMVVAEATAPHATRTSAA
jgi:hypothetical protein